eukprot:TRINITY_DN1288_c0_g1_i1.p1 TRINITY_DN1288_c0_g1~~TRINITY_DN1288_c0_g1_i1.p1  ORF type:complete len:184 (+),score=31.08 TRINITY_DN1288_c0_g1_i1:192-743(+)
MEDLTHGMSSPCILDLKMGRSSSEPSAPSKKKVEQGALDRLSTSDGCGFRVTGMRVYNKAKDTFTVREKPWGIALGTVDLPRAIESFFHNGIVVRRDLFVEALAKVKVILQWFQCQRLFRFFGSSILFIYDGAVDDGPVTVKMVDFAHTVLIRDGGKDEGYKFGLYTLVSILEQLLVSNPPPT